MNLSTDTRKLNGFCLILVSGLTFALVCQLFTGEPVSRYINVRNFRYGKDPYVIRCNRGDTLHLTFSTDDTGHSFFLEEFDIDAKVTPVSDKVSVFKVSDPLSPPSQVSKVTIVARHHGMKNYVVSKSAYRCHVWCGPMHAFEQGKIIIMPNTLLFFSLGSLAGMIIVWIFGFFAGSKHDQKLKSDSAGTDLLSRYGLLKKLVISRWPQLIVMIETMAMIYIVILTSVLGTKVSGRNLGVLMMWAIWLFILIAILTPFGGRIWCTVCPLPLFGDWLQRRSFFSPEKGRTGGLNNKFYGLFLKWPEKLSNNWFRLFTFLVLATFSTILVATPRISGLTVIMLLAVPTIMALIWELRAFCRYVCPVSVFTSPFSSLSTAALRVKSVGTCSKCRPKFCQKGNLNGWACPYGLNAAEIRENSDCGLCLECTRSCVYDNVTIYKRPFAIEYATRNLSEAWLRISVFSISIVYSILYLGPWPAIRDYVNILDKKNWGSFGIYSAALWTSVLVIVPAFLWFLTYSGVRISGIRTGMKKAFLDYTGTLLPLGFMIWVAFVIPMLFVNVTFIFQSLSDPFGWGWDFFGTANTPWHQFLPHYIPWMQAILVLSGLWLSLRNLKRRWSEENAATVSQQFMAGLPQSLFLILVTAAMIFFFTD